MLRRTLIALVTLAGFAVSLPANAQNGDSTMTAPTKSGFVPVDGGQVWYATYGSGEPLVLLHGGLMTVTDFGPVLAKLAETREVIAIEAQGHGHTGPLDRAMSYDAMAADVAAVIGTLGYDKADVMGYSTGGQVAARVGIDHPEVVDRLILASTPFATAGWHDYNLQGMAMIGEASAEGMKQTPMYAAFAAVNPDPEQNWVKLNIQQGKLVNTPYDWSAEVSGIKAPTMLVVGDWDSVRVAHAVKFFELLGGGAQDAQWDGSGMNHNRLAVLPGETHYSIFMSPRLAAAALSFIDAE
jgi:pimeloyl-ACP methyl ester carboxylesterase